MKSNFSEIVQGARMKHSNLERVNGEGQDGKPVAAHFKERVRVTAADALWDEA